LPQDKSDIITLYNDTILNLKSLNSVNSNLKSLIDKTAIQPAPIFEFKKNENDLFSIEVKDVALGYSVFLLLQNIGMYKNNKYNGETKFTINKTQLENLNVSLQEIKTKQTEFNYTLEAFLADDADKYSKTANKSTGEIIKGEVERKDGFMTSDALAKFRALPESARSILFSQVSLDATTHPNKDMVKQYLEECYAQADLKDNKGGKKVFMIGTYESILTSTQIEKILPELTAYANLSKNAKDMGYNGGITNPEFLQLFGVNIKESYCAYLKDVMLDVAKTLHPNWSHTTKKDEKYFNEVSNQFDTFINSTQNIKQQIGGYEKAMYAFLNENFGVGIKIKPSVNPITEAEKSILRKNGQELNATNLEFSIDKLKASNGFKEAVSQLEREGYTKQGIENALKNYKARLVKAFNGGGGYQASSNTVQKTAEFFLEYIAKIYYQQKSGVTTDSIATSLRQLIVFTSENINQSELKSELESCNEGFLGRTINLFNCLNERKNDNLIDDAINNSIRNKVETAFTKYINRGTSNSESAMAMVKQNIALSCFGLSDKTDPRYTDFNKDEFIKFASNSISPSAIYKDVKSAFQENLARALISNNDQDIVDLLISYGFAKHITPQTEDAQKRYIYEQFKLNEAGSKWNLSEILVKMPNVILSEMKERGFLHESAKTLQIQSAGSTKEYEVNAYTYENQSYEELSGLQAFMATQNNQSNQINSLSFFGNDTTPVLHGSFLPNHGTGG
jgi:hypothetical protein